MKFVLFYHSLISDWNHGNAHFLRGVCSELDALGHRVEVYEPRDGWSLRNLLQDQGPTAIRAFHSAYPRLSSHFYDPATMDLDRVLDGADVVICTNGPIQNSCSASVGMLPEVTASRCSTTRIIESSAILGRSPDWICVTIGVSLHSAR
jgi:hypothetical protein